MSLQRVAGGGKGKVHPRSFFARAHLAQHLQAEWGAIVAVAALYARLTHPELTALPDVAFAFQVLAGSRIAFALIRMLGMGIIFSAPVMTSFYLAFFVVCAALLQAEAIIAPVFTTSAILPWAMM